MTEQVLTPLNEQSHKEHLTTELALARKTNPFEFPNQVANEVVNSDAEALSDKDSSLLSTAEIMRQEAPALGNNIDILPIQQSQAIVQQAVSLEDPSHIAGMGEEIILNLDQNDPNCETEEYKLALKAKLLCTLGWRLAQCGAETRLIVQSVKTMAHSLGCSSIDISLTREGIIIKLRQGNKICVEFKEIKSFSINMDSLDRIHKLCLKVNSGELTDPKKIFLAIRAIRPRHYKHKHLIYIEAIAGACFAYLNGGDFAVCASAFLGGLFLMYARFMFIKRGFFEAFVFMLAAFFGSLISMLCAHYVFEADSSQVVLAATATTLLLVPGFPLINGFLDIFKGYVPVGLSRLVIAVVLIIAAAVGLLFTTYLGKSVIDLIPLAPINLKTLANLAFAF